MCMAWYNSQTGTAADTYFELGRAFHQAVVATTSTPHTLYEPKHVFRDGPRWLVFLPLPGSDDQFHSRGLRPLRWPFASIEAAQFEQVETSRAIKTDCRFDKPGSGKEWPGPMKWRGIYSAGQNS